MREQSVRPGDLRTGRWLMAFAALSILLLGALGIAPARSFTTEWRTVQERYNRLAQHAGKRPIEVRIRQIWKPDLDVVDRCGSCHLGAVGVEPVPGSRLFARHPQVAHDPTQFGCTVCHGGQGRATTERGAHGSVSHWDEPLIPRRHLEAGCSTCHTHIVIPNAELAERGRRVFDENRCGTCHRAGARGPAAGPVLSSAGLGGFRGDWHSHHAEAAAAETDDAGPWAAFSPLADEEIPAVTAYLGSLVGAPRLMEAKALAHRLGCRGCHVINGVGGDEGPDLSGIGLRPVSHLDFSGIRGEHTVAGWLTEHFLHTRRVVPGSEMPDLGLTRPQADLLTTYMLSLRSREIPAMYWPRDRVRGVRLGEREFATDGASLFGVFCAACHGVRGQGNRFGSANTRFPSIGSGAFLALADDTFLRRTLQDGRPGRRMPSWGRKESGLRPDEIDALVRYLRSLQPEALSFETVMTAPVDLELGRRVFQTRCVPCHGAGGRGSEIGPPLAARDNPVISNPNAIHGTLTQGIGGTAMGSFRDLDPPTMRAVIEVLVAMPPVDGVTRTTWHPQRGDTARGRVLFDRTCTNAACHGAGGTRGAAPGIGSPAFLAVASDGYLTATIVRGRAGTEMPAFGRQTAGHPQLGPREVADIVAYLRSLGRAAR